MTESQQIRGTVISKIVQELKKISNPFMKDNCDMYPEFQAWQTGYGGFSYRNSDRDQLIRYVKNQKEHHKKVSFQEEYIALLEEHNISYDLKYLFD